MQKALSLPFECAVASVIKLYYDPSIVYQLKQRFSLVRRKFMIVTFHLIQAFNRPQM